jgi:hypothetical protein
MKTATRLLLALLMPAVLIGCSTPHRDPEARSTIEIPSEDYERAIDAARAVLIENRFTIDRIDALRGIITTLPKQTSGIASPWDSEQSSMDQEWADLVHHQERVIRISFTRPNDDQPVEAHVLASIVRIRRPGWRLETESIRNSTHTTSITTNGSRVPATMREPVGEDVQLSAKLAHQIEQRLTQSEL